MMDLFKDSLTHAVMITGFVFMMMVVVEYLNVLTGGMWQKWFRGSRWRQYLIAALLGVTPGCLGAFVVVTLYSHRVVGLGAVVAAMIATSGDESFVMLAMIPQTALLIFVILFLVGIAAGYLTDTFLGEAANPAACPQELELHGMEACNCFPSGEIAQQWRRCSMARGVLSVVLALFIFGLFTGQIGPTEWNWIRVTILLVSVTALFIVSTVPDHFLEEHLWNHVAKLHVPRVFLWTAGALLLMHLLIHRFHLQDWMQENTLIMLAFAAVIGIVPESGPHLVFLTLFTENAIPLSVLLASSIVQDGHGMLPLLAESRRDFLKIKAINLVVGLLMGLIGYIAGY
ncbi:MAG: arsenic efflux protein [Proteobacteria bacterium]|nr:arsenic efflux protein [Pseudomonadota bacterium]